MRKLIVILMLLVSINCSFGQVRFGLKAGGNLANLDGFNKSRIKLGVNVGPIAQINMAKLFFIQSELLYSLKGTQSTATVSGNNAIVNLNYINLPVLFGLRAQNFSIKLGPEIGHLVSAKVKLDGETNDLSGYYRDFDFGADLGLAYTFKKLSLDLRYNYGFKDLLPGDQPNQEGFNRVLQFSLCYFLGKK